MSILGCIVRGYMSRYKITPRESDASYREPVSNLKSMIFLSQEEWSGAPKLVLDEVAVKDVQSGPEFFFLRSCWLAACGYAIVFCSRNGKWRRQYSGLLRNCRSRFGLFDLEYRVIVCKHTRLYILMMIGVPPLAR